MKYGYARVSTVHQRKESNSLEVQRLRLQQGCDWFSGARMVKGALLCLIICSSAKWTR